MARSLRQRRQLRSLRRATDEVDYRNLILAERLFLSVSGAKVQVSGDQVLARFGVEHDSAADALAVGQNKRGALHGRQQQPADAHYAGDGKETSCHSNPPEVFPFVDSNLDARRLPGQLIN